MYRFRNPSVDIAGLSLAITLAISPPSIAQSDISPGTANPPPVDQPGMGAGAPDDQSPMDASPPSDENAGQTPPDASTPDDGTKKNEGAPDPD